MTQSEMNFRDLMRFGAYSAVPPSSSADNKSRGIFLILILEQDPEHDVRKFVNIRLTEIDQPRCNSIRPQRSYQQRRVHVVI